MRTLLGALCAAILISSAHASVDIAGVKFEEQSQLENQTLTLNGAGLRTRFFFKVYAVALYLSTPAHDTPAVLSARGPRRIDIVTLRDLTAKQFTDALADGLKKNLNAAELAAVQSRFDRFIATLLAIENAKEGTRITIDFVPATGTELHIDGAPTGAPIDGLDFYNALLRVWIGDKPAQDDLKQALLGKSP